jgi:VWFA-related protein
MMRFIIHLAAFAAIALTGQTALAQPFTRSIAVGEGTAIQVVNRFGRVEVSAVEKPGGSDVPAVILTAASSGGVQPIEVRVSIGNGKILIEAAPSGMGKRIDLSLEVPIGSKLSIETTDGEARTSGPVAGLTARTETGTIAADVPTDDLRYIFRWSQSRPRFLSDIKLAPVKEKAAGKFEIKGRFASPSGGELARDGDAEAAYIRRSVSLDLSTARGIILLNIPPAEVTGDLRERPLTEAAKAIIRSGDSLLMEAIRRAAPKYFSDYASTLPPAKMEPAFVQRQVSGSAPAAVVKRASVRVMDGGNRAVAGLSAGDFEIIENNVRREIIKVETASAPVNLVLLLDVSGSVENYVNFIRKAARNFVDTVDERDRVAIVTFNEDVRTLSGFTTDKARLSASLDTFDAGGATAYYDSLAYVLADTLRPLKGERTAIVILTDGDDNRSFLPFESMLASIQESGALIYPLYVPSSLIAASLSPNEAPLDNLRMRYLHGELTSKAMSEGPRLADASGGTFFPITQLSQIQTAYNDIAAQLRTSYNITYRSDTADVSPAGAPPRLRVRVGKPNVFTSVRSVVRVE